MTVRKAVITAGGLGTRLLPATKETPKEMLPIFAFNQSKGVYPKPVVQVVFESLYEVGFRDFCFVVGRGKRAVEDHFTPDYQFIHLLERKGLKYQVEELNRFYHMIVNSKILFVNQPEPRGFGDAVLRAESFVSSEPFLVHAGDDLILSDNSSHLRRLLKTFNKNNADIVFLVEEVENSRQYGVVKAEFVEKGVLHVSDIVEKPQEPPSNLAVVAIYVFKPSIFDKLKKTKPDKKGEIQLTDAIKAAIDSGERVFAVKLHKDEKRLDVGNPRRYWDALRESYEWALNKVKG